MKVRSQGEVPVALRAVMEAAGRRLESLLFLLLLLSAVAAGAQTNEASSDPVIQGRQIGRAHV